MSYQKFLVDNPQCSRRFHISFDDEAPKVPHTAVKCQHCGVVVFARDDHAPLKMARDENLTKTTELTKELMRECRFEDPFEKQKVRKPKVHAKHDDSSH